MKDKIANKIIKAIYMHQDTSLNIVEVGNEIADQILSLLKEEGWIPPHGYDISSGVCEVCDQLNSDKMRKHGWFHKDDLTDVLIPEKCPTTQYMPACPGKDGCEYSSKGHNTIPICNGSGTISRPLTVGEVLERAKRDT